MLLASRNFPVSSKLSPLWRKSLDLAIFFSMCKPTIFRWFMPVNIGITFLVGGVLGWVLVKLLKPRPHLEGLVIATCSSGRTFSDFLFRSSNIQLYGASMKFEINWLKCGVFSGNLGNLMLIIIPAICNENGSPFGNRDVCGTVGLSYASFSMAVWQCRTLFCTRFRPSHFTFNLMRIMKWKWITK